MFVQTQLEGMGGLLFKGNEGQKKEENTSKRKKRPRGLTSYVFYCEKGSDHWTSHLKLRKKQ